MLPEAPKALRPPAVGIVRNPLLTLAESDLRIAPAGATVHELRPANVKGPLRCYLNGESLYPVTDRQFAYHARLLRAGRVDEARAYLRRAVKRELNWKRTTVRVGDTLVWHEVTQSRGLLQALIVVAAVVYGVYTGDWKTAFQAASWALLAVNVFLPPRVPTINSPDTGKDIFSINLAGNQARLDQPIWRNCGLTKITPPFAAIPYYEYIDEDGDNLDADQFLHVVYAVGVGKQDVLRVFVGKTPMDHLDVKIARYLPPGTQPGLVLCNVVTSIEVSGIELMKGIYTGGYVACRPDQRCAAFGVDFAAPQGLGTATGEPVTVAMRIEIREVDRFGRPTTVWRVVGTEVRSASTGTPQRWSFKYLVMTPARIEVRAVRTDTADSGSGTRSSIQWIGLRGYLDQAAPLNPNTGHYELMIRASDQLGQQAQTEISMIVQGYARTWNPSTGFFDDAATTEIYTATRNPAWWVADLWTDPIWGEGLPDERINLQGLYDFAQICDTRQDRFDFTFTSSMNAWDAAQLIARAGRARCFRRFGVNTLVRDQAVTLPTTAFTHRNTVPGTMTLTEKLPVRESADGYMIEYTSNVTWDTETIECPCPGYSVSDPSDPRYNPALPAMSAPVYLKLEGIKGATHAQREGLYEAAVLLWRNRMVSCKTEMQGVIPCYGDPVRWMPEIAGYGQTGDVTNWDADTLVMTLTEPADFSLGATYLSLIRDDGSITSPVLVTPGPEANQVRLPAAPDFTLMLHGAQRERPKFLLGTLADADELVKITAIADGGKSDAEDGQAGAQLFDISAVVDDPRVHTVDVHLLPGPGDNQDPIDTDPLPEGNLLLVHLEDHAGFVATGSLTNWLYNQPIGGVAGSLDARADYFLGSDGHGWARTFYAPYGDGNLGVFTSEWVYGSTIEPTTAALYEVRATYLATLPDIFLSQGVAIGPPNYGDPVDTWLNLGTTRVWGMRGAAWGLTDGDNVAAMLRFEIREVANPSVIQASSTVIIGTFPPFVPESGGGNPGTG